MIIKFPTLNADTENEVLNTPAKEKVEKISTDYTSFEKIVEKAEEIQKKCSDYVIGEVNPSTFQFNSDATVSYNSNNGYRHHVDISRYALGQLGTKIGVPGQYVQKCIDTGRNDLAQENINSWIKTYNGGFFVREYDDRIRGILSPKYSVYDTPDILNIIGDTVDMSNYNIKGNYFNEERLHVRFTGKEMMNIDGEDLFPGIFIDTSDVGRSTLIIQFGIYKLVCTNGLVIARAGGILYKQKHMGIDPEEFRYRITASVKNIPDLITNAEEWIKKAKSKKMDAAQMESVMKTMHLNENAQENVITLMNERYEDNKWGFINGVTEIAQRYTLERRIEIERLAGNLLVAA